MSVSKDSQGESGPVSALIFLRILGNIAEKADPEGYIRPELMNIHEEGDSTINIRRSFWAYICFHQTSSYLEQKRSRM